MNKKEMFRKMEDIFMRIENMEGSLFELAKEARSIRQDMEELPSEESELDPDESDEDK